MGKLNYKNSAKDHTNQPQDFGNQHAYLNLPANNQQAQQNKIKSIEKNKAKKAKDTTSFALPPLGD